MSQKGKKKQKPRAESLIQLELDFDVHEAPSEPERIVLSGSYQTRALHCQLLEKICEHDNLMRAAKHVMQNNGAAGVDGMAVSELMSWLRVNENSLVKSLKSGTYRPKAIRGVKIPKPAGGTRTLGIPTAIDRFIQQAIRQVIEPLLDATFSEYSYGFRSGRSCMTALRQSRAHILEGNIYVVDVDIESYFDRVNHDMLMSRLSRHFGDKDLLKLIRRFLESGMMLGGISQDREEGTPQGGPLSPLLANLFLDDLDKELERRGHRFCRYADDFNIYVKSQRAADRVLVSISEYLEKKLKLKVNASKSGADRVDHRAFLSYVITPAGKAEISPKALTRFRCKVSKLTRRNCGKSMGFVISELNKLLKGWLPYFRYDHRGTIYSGLDRKIRRRLRCFRLYQLRTCSNIIRYLEARHVEGDAVFAAGKSSRGWWYQSCQRAIHIAMQDTHIHDELGLYSLYVTWEQLNA